MMVKSTLLFVFTLIALQRFVHSASVCTIFEYQCSSGKCIPTDWRCNGEKECNDGSDELLCNKAMPEKINKLKVVPKDKTSVVVSWVPERLINSPPVTSFTLQYREISSDVHNTRTLSRSLRSILITNLQPLGIYEFSISAANDLGRGPRSDPVLVRVEPKKPEEPLLQGVPLNSTAILISWPNTNESPVLGYFVQYKNVMEGESKRSEEFTIPVASTESKALLTKGIKEGKTYRITVQPFTAYGYGFKLGPVLVNTPTVRIEAPEFTVAVDENSITYDAILAIEPSQAANAYALRFGKGFAKSLPVRNEKVTLLSSDFTSGNIKIEPFLWHYFGLSMQSAVGRWSQERSKWLRGPLQGYTGFSNSPHSVTLLWSQIDPSENPDTYIVAFRATDDITKSEILVNNNKKLGFTRIKIGALRDDTMYDFEIRNGDANCDKRKRIKLSVKTKAKNEK